MADQLQLYGTGDLAQVTGAKIHRIRYILKKLGIQPIGRLAHYGIYPAEVLPAIQAELQAIERRKAECNAS